MFLKLGTRQECSFPPFLLDIVLEFLATAIDKKKGMKGIQIGKEEIKLSLFADDMIVHIENSKRLNNKKLLEQVSSYSEVAGCKVNTQMFIAF